MKILYKTIILLFIFLITSNITHSQSVTQEWEVRYNSIFNRNDVATDMVIDESGNVYVTGYSEGFASIDNIITAKYNTNGVQQWIAVYDGINQGSDKPSAIKTDLYGNTYITGYSDGLGTGLDFVTIKYNSNGILQWVRTYNGLANQNDYANDIAIDNSGNVYITGSCWNGVTGNYMITIKYNSDGIQQWVSIYNSPLTGNDVALAIAVDNLGNVFLTGSSSVSLSNFLFTTIKYNTNGIQQWVRNYNGPASKWNESKDIIVDKLGNVYITGESQGINTIWDFTTIKYNSIGEVKWVARYNGSGNGYDGATCIALDNFGNIFVTGYSTGINSSRDYTTIKYDSIGIQQWVAIYNGISSLTDVAYSVTSDSLGNSYVTGTSYVNISNSNCVTIKYNSLGIQQWIQNYDGPTSFDDISNSIALESNGNVYICGGSHGIGTSFDYFIIKYSQSVGIHNLSNELPNKFSLMQNYPNPFNPSTTIKFDIQKQGLVTLKVYDMLGKEVSTLVNESLSPGIYKADFTADGLTSGVYFYRLITDDFSDVKRMLLIK